MADNTINGTAGDDILQTPDDGLTNEVYGGDGNDFIVDGGVQGNQDSFYGGAGNDNILAGSGNDVIDTGTGDDNATGAEGDDTFLVQDNFGTDSLDGGTFQELNGDLLDATGMTAGATLTFGVDIEVADTGGGPGGGGPGGGDGPPGTGGPGDGGGDPLNPDEPTTTTVQGALLEAGPGNTAEIQNVEEFILGAGNDTVIDDGGDNSVNMGAGDDEFRITDGFGADTVNGGDGGETIGDVINGSAITPDVVVTFTADGIGTFSDGIDTLTFEGIERVETGAGNDSIVGGAGDDSVDGNAGDDIFVMSQGGGADFFRGGEGGETTGDILDGAALTSGVTIVYTGDAATLTQGGSTGGFAEVEHVILGSGNDTITGGTSDDSITANAGDDSFAVLDDFGNDTIALGAGTDTIDGSGLTTDATVDFTAAGDGTLSTGLNTVTFTSAEALSTGAGNDTINHSAADENIATGGGDDVYNLDNGFGNDSWDAGADTDTIDATLLEGATTATFNNDGSGTLTNGTDSLSFQDVEVLTTSSGNDTITASRRDETIQTGDGDDTIFISDDFGNDTLDGGNGGESAGDRLDASALTSGVTLTLTDAENGTLNNGSDTLSFVEFEDIVLGTGNDTVIGSADNDSIETGDGDDSFVLADGFGTDNVAFSAGNESQGDTLDGTALTSDATVTISGNTTALTAGSDSVTATDAERIITGSGNDTINAGTGDETVFTNAGDDTFIVDENSFGTDQWDAGSGGETQGDHLDASGLTADTTVTLTNGSDGSLTNNSNTLTFTNVETITTGAGDDTIFASAGNDTVSTGGGDDRIVLTDNLGTDTIAAGETGENTGDALDGSALTEDVTLTLSSAGNGTFTAGGETVSFTGIETFETGSGLDTATGSAGSDTIALGEGDDTYIIADNFGDDSINFGEGGLNNGDTLDGSALTNDVTINFTSGENGTVTDDTDTLTFRNLENVITGAGNDTVTGANDGDSVATGAGDDTFVIDDGFGDDVFNAGEGGETSGDTLDASALGGSSDATVTLAADGSGTLTEGGDSVTFTDVERVLTGSGDDTILGSSGDDVVATDSGDDTFVITDGFGTDSFDAGELGSTFGDQIDGTALTGNAQVDFSGDEAGTLTVGTDTVTFSNVEIIQTGSGNDSITGSVGDDQISTGAGDDRIEGNAGADVIYAGGGNDTIIVSDGDQVFAGTGDDVIFLEDTNESGNETIFIDGGDEDTKDGDILRLGKLADMSTLNTSPGGGGSLNGSVMLKDGTTLNFENIENIICFTPGTMIKTPHGPRDIATLRVGDMVRTRDHGPQKIRWIQSRTVPAIERFAPIRLRAGVLTSLTSDLLVSPQHRMMFQGYEAEVLFGEREVLIPAIQLVNGKDVTQDAGDEVTYIHMMFDQHEIVYANGAASESFHPGTIGLSAVTEAAREELFSLFPTLRSDPNGYGQTARRCLRMHETQLLSV